MDFNKNHEYLICVDSDGTAIDSMNIKHKKCFGPCFVKEWALEAYGQEALELWNNVNLYNKTRGKNRFITLLECLEYFNGKYIKIDGLDIFKNWIENTKELSNGSLKKEIEINNSLILKKTLDWSVATNDAISKLTFNDVGVFAGVKEFLECAHKQADIAIVSSANYQAVLNEWTHFGLMDYVDVIATQEIGSKTACINVLLEKGYQKENVLMIGDAPPDLQAAKASGVLFYPIITEQEQASWAELKAHYVEAFLKGKYNQKLLITKFENNFA